MTLGTTTTSFRLVDRPYYPKSGNIFFARSDSKQLEGLYKCVEKRRMAFGVMKSRHWQGIGLGSREAYEALMVDILGDDLPQDEAKGVFFRFVRIE